MPEISNVLVISSVPCSVSFRWVVQCCSHLFILSSKKCYKAGLQTCVLSGDANLQKSGDRWSQLCFQQKKSVRIRVPVRNEKACTALLNTSWRMASRHPHCAICCCVAKLYVTVFISCRKASSCRDRSRRRHTRKNWSRLLRVLTEGTVWEDLRSLAARLGEVVGGGAML